MIAPCARYMSSIFLLETGCAGKRPWCLRVFRRLFSSSDFGCENRPAHVGKSPCFFQRRRSARACEQTQTNMIAPCNIFLSCVFLLQTACASKRPWCLHVFRVFSCDFGCENRPAHVGKSCVFFNDVEKVGRSNKRKQT